MSKKPEWKNDWIKLQNLLQITLNKGATFLFAGLVVFIGTSVSLGAQHQGVTFIHGLHDLPDTLRLPDQEDQQGIDDCAEMIMVSTRTIPVKINGIHAICRPLKSTKDRPESSVRYEFDGLIRSVKKGRFMPAYKFSFRVNNKGMIERFVAGFEQEEGGFDEKPLDYLSPSVFSESRAGRSNLVAYTVAKRFSESLVLVASKQQKTADSYDWFARRESRNSSHEFLSGKKRYPAYCEALCKQKNGCLSWNYEPVGLIGALSTKCELNRDIPPVQIGYGSVSGVVRPKY